MRSVKSAPDTLRAERAEATRRRIEAAARLRFARDGYAATTLKAVAREAGVAVQTVYAVFGSKAGILRALRESVAHDPEAAALYVAALAEPDPAARLAGFASSIRARWEHGADVVAIQADAAASEPSLRDEEAVVLAMRRAGIERLVASFGPGGPSDPRRAVAIVDALTLPKLYSELVEVHRWSGQAYEDWLAAALGREVLEAGEG
jgi:AcrR family transcriptional regulator